MRSHKWVDIAISADDRHQELLIGKLASLGFTGFLQNDGRLDCYIPSRHWTVSTRNEFVSFLDRFKAEFALSDLDYTIAEIREKNWNRTWEKQAGIVQATPNIVIKPSWKTLPPRLRKQLILHIDPKMSFGTGHHETTRLCLRLLERHIEPESTILDFGCGTGILGIACAKLGARRVTAVDRDPWAIKNVRENVKRNHVQRKVFTRLGSISAIPQRSYDLVAANLDTKTIERFIRSLSRLTRSNGTMVLSGILAGDLEHLLPEFKKNSLMPIELVYENEWIAAALRKTRNASFCN
jgi:ribosomal protein L11 methyltransferase